MANIRQLRRMMKGGGGPRRAGRNAGQGGDDTPLLSVDPRQTDARLTEWIEPHLASVDPEVPANGLLFLFLCGSNGLPSRQTLITQHAASMGYHAINLRYPNSWTVGGLGRQSNDPNSHEHIREAIFEGVPCADLPQVREPDSIRNRLEKLLVWLAQNQGPSWEQFLSAGKIRWSNTVVAGHSQGGGHAALIGKRQETHRVIMLGSPVDHNRGIPSPWLSRPGATPASRHFGFAHQQDQGFDQIIASWEAIGLAQFGPVINVDRAMPPYGLTHQLTSNLPVPRDKYHPSVVVDAVLPLTGNGAPAYLPVWNYLLDPATSPRS